MNIRLSHHFIIETTWEKEQEDDEASQITVNNFLSFALIFLFVATVCCLYICFYAQNNKKRWKVSLILSLFLLSFYLFHLFHFTVFSYLLPFFSFFFCYWMITNNFFFAAECDVQLLVAIVIPLLLLVTEPRLFILFFVITLAYQSI